MKKAWLYVVSLVLLASGSAYGYDNGDFQIWHTEAQEFKIIKDYKIDTEEEFRWGGDASELYYQHYDIGLVYSANSNLDVGLNYRQVYEKKSGKFKEENRPHVNLTVKTNIYGFKLEDRNRFQYRHFRYQADYCTYRNKFAVKYPLSLYGFELGPYVADEIFVDLKDKGGFTRNRFYSGLGVKITKNVNGELFYLLQSTKGSGSWIEAHVLGTKLKISF